MGSIKDSLQVLDLEKAECSFCGEKTPLGGHWRGIGTDIFVCTSTDCVEASIHVALDAMFDALYRNKDTASVAEQHRHWSQFVERIFWYKQYLRFRE